MVNKDTNKKWDKLSKKDKEAILFAWERYHNDWMHRDNMLVRQVYIFYICALTVILLPYLKILKEDFTNNINPVVWFFVGFIISIAFLLYSIGYAYRVKAVSMNLERIYRLFEGTILERVRLEELKEGRKIRGFLIDITKSQISRVISILMFVSLIIVDIVGFLYMSSESDKIILLAIIVKLIIIL